MRFANIAIPAPVHSAFTYKVPEEIAIQPGSRVIVPFRSRQVVGLCLEVTDSPPPDMEVKGFKIIEEVPDDKAALSPNLLRLIRWMADYYLAPIGEVCRAALPGRMTRPSAPKTTRPQTPIDIKPIPEEQFDLNQDQHRVLESMIDAARRKIFAPFLIHGITGSGKTEIYLRLFAWLADQGRQGLLLVPEIALTPQLTGRAAARFGDRVAVYHSGLTDAQRHHQWLKMREGQVDVVIGTRSALFAPLKKLGAIVVDEEHDGSYKQDEGFAYHARDAAVKRAQIENALAVLGSATPSIESLVNARQGKYTYHHLPSRTGGASLPSVEIIDMRRPRRHGRGQWKRVSRELCALSPELYDALEERLKRGEQSLLFIGRRGFATSVHCEGCGEVFSCPNCDIALSAHLPKKRGISEDTGSLALPGGILVCHYCDCRMPIPVSCPACAGHLLTPLGQGTERLEAEIQDLFPQARVARLDSDMVTSPSKRRRIFDQMRGGKIDILVGTQMVTKGHDFPSITLVGVVNADTLLHLPDFRSAERTFQLITQVAGRAGRRSLPGQVLIQTYQPQHYSLLAARDHDIDSFINQEIRHRRALCYPPFSRLANIRLSSNSDKMVADTARQAAAILTRTREHEGFAGQIAILGPAPSPLPKLRGRYRWQLLLKASTPGTLTKFLILSHPLLQEAKPHRVRLAIDVDPVNML
jgi:primosomal protein N' (replication factor Y)